MFSTTTTIILQLLKFDAKCREDKIGASTEDMENKIESTIS